MLLGRRQTRVGRCARREESYLSGEDAPWRRGSAAELARRNIAIIAVKNADFPLRELFLKQNFKIFLRKYSCD